MATLNANKMLKILISMLERSWKNENLMHIAIRDFASLFKEMTFTRTEWEEFERIYNSLTLEPVSWDEFITEYNLQMGLGNKDETADD